MTWDWKKALQSVEDFAQADPRQRRGKGSAGPKGAAFNGEGRASVTWRQASARGAQIAAGKAVSLLQAQQHDCGYCRGKGQVSNRGPCLICHGSGKVKAGPPAIRCAYCRGRGQVPPNSHLACSVCKGKGVVAVAEPVLCCPACRGLGKKPGQALSCPHCGGTGVVARYDPTVRAACYLL